MIPSIGFAGFSNSGKTTVLASLTEILTRRGYKVATVKHASHGYEMDIPGKDSWQHFHAGAQKVIVAGPVSLTIHERLEQQPDLSEILKHITGVDIVLIEGFKHEPGPKIEVIQNPESPRVQLGGNLVAIVSNNAVEGEVPRFSFDALEGLAEFLIKGYLQTKRY